MGAVVTASRTPSRMLLAAVGAAVACLAAALAAPAPADRASAAESKCVRDLDKLTLTGCDVLFNDTAEEVDPEPIWGAVDCERPDRQRRIVGGADPHETATGAEQPDAAFRELEVHDGDDFFGERCELGRNDHRFGPTALYDEGDRRVTFASYRLPVGYPLASERWQVVMQIKQSFPSANSGGTPVLELEAKRGAWRLLQSNSPGQSSGSRELWSAPAEIGVWTRFAFDARYSKSKKKGSIRAYADLNEDGDSTDNAERSAKFKTFTLKKETGGGGFDDGLPAGRPIPSHLRVGYYHDREIGCAENTCAVQVDNVQVVDPR